MAHDEEEGEETRMRKKEDAKETIVFEHVFWSEATKMAKNGRKWRSRGRKRILASCNQIWALMKYIFANLVFSVNFLHEK